MCSLILKANWPGARKHFPQNLQAKLGGVTPIGSVLLHVHTSCVGPFLSLTVDLKKKHCLDH